MPVSQPYPSDCSAALCPLCHAGLRTSLMQKTLFNIVMVGVTFGVTVVLHLYFTHYVFTIFHGCVSVIEGSIVRRFDNWKM